MVPRHSAPVATLLLLILCAPRVARAQTVTDGVMMPRRDLCTGFLYDRDQWSNYWEGTLERDNLNIGTLTTQSVTWVGQLRRHGPRQRHRHGAVRVDGRQRGHAARPGRAPGPHRWPLKVNALTVARRAAARSRPSRSGSWAAPLSDYTPDFYPLSLGSASRRASGRADPELHVAATGST